MKKQLLLHLLLVSFVFAEWESMVPLLSEGAQIRTKSTLTSKNSPEIALVDWDKDGDLDLIFFDVYTAPNYAFRYFENIGTKESYNFIEREPLNSVSTPYPS